MESSLMEVSQNFMNSTVNSHGVSFDKALDMSDTIDKIIKQYDDCSDDNKYREASFYKLNDNFDNLHYNIMEEYDRLNQVMDGLEKPSNKMNDNFDNLHDNIMEEYDRLNQVMDRLNNIWKERKISKTSNCSKETDNVFEKESNGKSKVKDNIDTINKDIIINISDQIIQCHKELSIIMEVVEEKHKTYEQKGHESDNKCNDCEINVECTDKFKTHDENIQLFDYKNSTNGQLIISMADMIVNNNEDTFLNKYVIHNKCDQCRIGASCGDNCNTHIKNIHKGEYISVSQGNKIKSNKKKGYRGRGKINKRDKIFSVMLINLRGFRSKEVSLNKVLKEVNPSMVALNETQLSGRMKVELESYSCWSKNRIKQGGGGIATAVAQRYKDLAIGAGEGTVDDEYLITRIENFHPALNVINCYGEQRKTNKEEVEAKWRRLHKDMKDIRARNEFCLLVGDLNKLVGCDDLGVPGNHPEISTGGKLLRDMLQTGDWFLVNGLGDEVVEGGPFTRQDPATGKLSCLDLFVVSRELRPYVKKLFIDSKRKLVVARPVKDKGKVKLVYPDHFPAIITFTNLPNSKKSKVEKITGWNFARSGGWEKYKEMCDKYSRDLDEVVDNKDLSIQEVMKEFIRIHNKINFKSFGKVSMGTRQEKQSFTELGDTDLDEETKANELNEEYIKRTEDELDRIKKSKQGKIGQIWSLRKKVLGKSNSVATAIVNPNTGKLTVFKQDIKQISLDYCIATLANNPPENGFEGEIERKKELVKNILSLKDGNFGSSIETFKNKLKKFSLSGKKSYDPITKASKSFQDVIYKFCQRMFTEEKFPDEFRNTTLHMIFKGKGRREILENNRFIHCKDWLARVAEGLVVEDGLKEPLVSASSIYQIGGQPFHRPEELIFVMKSIIAKYRLQGKLVIIQCFDVRKYFDKEMIEDAVLTCTKRGADPKAVRLWFKLNDDTRIKIQTGVGMCNSGAVGAVVGQGSFGAALVSQAVLDDGVMEHFPPAGDLQLRYGSVPLAPLMFQDDLINGAEGLSQAREANKKVDFLMKHRGLALNEEKSVFLVMGSKKQKEKIRNLIKKEPLMCGKFETKEKSSEKWLGQFLSSAGLSDSVAVTVEARMGKTRGACLEIVQIVNDWRSQRPGGMESAILLWEACCITSLLNGSGTWVEMSNMTERKLDSLQHWFLRLVLQVGPGAPLASLLWDFALLDMELRIWREKIMLVLHCRMLGEDTLAGKMYLEQKANQWPGLVEETETICQNLSIESVHTTTLSAKAFRENVTRACHIENERRLKDKAEGKTKCSRIFKEKYGKKEYVSGKDIHDTRQLFRTRFGLQPFAGNYSQDPRFAKTGWLCRCRDSREDESHLLSGKCEVYGEIREKYGNLENDDDLVNFFNEVLSQREALEIEEEGCLY